MSNSKETTNFHIGDVLSVTHGIIVSPQGLEGILDFLSYLFQRPVPSTSAPEAAETCTPLLLEQHPWLEEISAEDVYVYRDDRQEWLDQVIEEYGEYVAIKPVFHSDTQA